MFRLYIDESGDHTYRQLDQIDRRYLGLVGCWFDLEEYQSAFQPQFETLKEKHFRHDPDEPVLLHREDLINKRGHFRVLQDRNREEAFNADLLGLVKDAKFTLVAIVIDKKARRERYGEAAQSPYVFCLTALVERYCRFLNLNNERGDVMAESRGKVEDLQIKDAFKHVYSLGDTAHSAEWFQTALTSHEIKLKPKLKNIAGLQLADIVAHPVKQDILLENGRLQSIREGFGRRLCQLLASKYDRRMFSG